MTEENKKETLDTEEQQLECGVCETKKATLLSFRNINNKTQEIRLVCPTCGAMSKLKINGHIVLDKSDDSKQIKMNSSYLS